MTASRVLAWRERNRQARRSIRSIDIQVDVRQLNMMADSSIPGPKCLQRDLDARRRPRDPAAQPAPTDEQNIASNVPRRPSIRSRPLSMAGLGSFAYGRLSQTAPAASQPQDEQLAFTPAAEDSKPAIESGAPSDLAQQPGLQPTASRGERLSQPGAQPPAERRLANMESFNCFLPQPPGQSLQGSLPVNFYRRGRTDSHKQPYNARYQDTRIPCPDRQVWEPYAGRSLATGAQGGYARKYHAASASPRRNTRPSTAPPERRAKSASPWVASARANYPTAKRALARSYSSMVRCSVPGLRAIPEHNTRASSKPAAKPAARSAPPSRQLLAKLSPSGRRLWTPPPPPSPAAQPHKAHTAPMPMDPPPVREHKLQRPRSPVHLTKLLHSPRGVKGRQGLEHSHSYLQDLQQYLESGKHGGSVSRAASGIKAASGAQSGPLDSTGSIDKGGGDSAALLQRVHNAVGAEKHGQQDDRPPSHKPRWNSKFHLSKGSACGPSPAK